MQGNGDLAGWLTSALCPWATSVIDVDSNLPMSHRKSEEHGVQDGESNDARCVTGTRRLVIGLAFALSAMFASPPLRAEVAYETEVVGTEDKQLLSEVKAVAKLVTLQDKPPATDAALRRRAEEDLPRLKQVLQSQGYWQGTVDYTLDLAAKPAKVTLEIHTGPLFRLRQVSLVTPQGEPAPDIASLDPDVFGLKLGEPAKSAPVLDAERKITDEYARRGRPFAKVVDRKTVVDVGTDAMSVTYIVEAGPRAKFGPVTIEGLTRLESTWVERRIAWQEGQEYDQRPVDQTRKLLIDSGLFSSVQIGHADRPSEAGEVPMHIVLAERPRRSLGGGLSYATNIGFGANGFWEDRNLFGGAEKLHLDVDIAEQRRDLRANFRDPDFLRKDQDLTTLAEYVDENPIAYTAHRQLLYPGVERRFAGVYTAGLGFQVQRATVTEEARDITRSYSLAGIPLFVRRDTRTDILNPQGGSRESLTLTPNTSMTGASLNFVNIRFDGDIYRRVSQDFLIAGFLGLGSIFGEARDSLPADQRFYAGGGGSLRGYAYQVAGPLAPNDRPLGGRSLLQAGIELRARITDTIGLVPFVEAGNVYESVTPDLGKGLLADVGLGLRYNTPLGPVRLDVATPLVRRRADSVVQVYISIGQAF